MEKGRLMMGSVTGKVVMHRSNISLDWDSYYMHWDTIQNGVYHSESPSDLLLCSDGGL